MTQYSNRAPSLSPVGRNKAMQFKNRRQHHLGSEGEPGPCSPPPSPWIMSLRMHIAQPHLILTARRVASLVPRCHHNGVGPAFQLGLTRVGAGNIHWLALGVHSLNGSVAGGKRNETNPEAAAHQAQHSPYHAVQTVSDLGGSRRGSTGACGPR
jgi:hypothetical protein